MSSLQYVIDLIKQVYAWFNERLEKWGLEGRKLQAAKLLTLAVLITVAYFVINPLPWEQSHGLKELKSIHLSFKSGAHPEWPLDWKPIAPATAKAEEKKGEKDDKQEESDEETAAAAPAGGQTSMSVSDFAKAVNLVQMEKYEAARKLLTEVKEESKDEQLISVLNNLGFVEIHLGKYQEAVADLTAAEELKAKLRKSLKKEKTKDRFLLSWTDISTRANLGEAYFYAGQMKNARESLFDADNDADAMKETLPANFRAEIAFYLGLVDLLNNDEKGAIRSLQKASNLEDSVLPAEGPADPNELSNWAASKLCLAMAWQSVGQLDQAKKTYKSVDERLNTPNTVLGPEALRIVHDSQSTTLPLWQKVFVSVLPNQEVEK